MSEPLFTCPDCGHENFTERGLRAHRGNKTCLKRQAANTPPPEEPQTATASVVVIESAPLVMMTLSEAEASTAFVKTELNNASAHIGNARQMLFDIQSREGWKALGHKSFKEYAKAEFGYEKSHTYRLAEAGRVERLLGESSLSTEQLLTFSDLPDDKIRSAWEQAKAMGENGVPNPAQIKYAIGAALGIQPKAPKAPRRPRKPKAGESVQVVIKPSLGICEANWKPKAAEGITLTCHINRDTDLPKLLTGLHGVGTQVEEAIAKLYASRSGSEYAGSLNSEIRTDY